jgi:lysozyme
MRISKMGIDLIKKFEGFRSKSYVCPAGYKTIGYGHVITNNDKNYKEIVSQEQADTLLLNDLELAENSVLRNIKVSLTQWQFDALVSFTFNLGAAALQRSTLKQKINRLEHDLVPKELMRWVYVGGKVMPGLLRRRIAEATLYNAVN